jgi:hypothetical protein
MCMQLCMHPEFSGASSCVGVQQVGQARSIVWGVVRMEGWRRLILLYLVCIRGRLV